MKEEIESELADQDLLPILQIEGNKTCNDCTKQNPRWCSINNAVLLCSSCARTHKKFNQNVSKIKSLEVDQWTKQEISFLKIGGNERFTKMIKSYNIPLTKENQEYKYYTRAAQYYRDILVEESKNNSIISIIKPSLKEGIELLYKDEYSNLFNKYNNQQNNVNNNANQLNANNNVVNYNNLANNNNTINNNNTMNNNNEGLKNNENASWVDKIIDKITPDIDGPYNPNNTVVNNINRGGNFLDNIANNMLYAFNDVKERAKDIDIKEKFKLAGEYVQNKTERIQNSDTFKGIIDSVSSGIDTIIQKTDQFFKPEQNKVNAQQINNNQNIQQQSNMNNNIDFNSPYVQNNNQNTNNTGLLNNIVNKVNQLNQPTFKSNYSSINNDRNDQYNNYINELSEKSDDINNNINNNVNVNPNINNENNINNFNNPNNNINSNINNNNINNNNINNNINNENNNNINNLNEGKKLEENIVKDNEKNNEDNVESLDNPEPDNNPNLLIMSNTPKI